MKAVHLLVAQGSSPDPPGGCRVNLLRLDALTTADAPKARQQQSISAPVAHAKQKQPLFTGPDRAENWLRGFEVVVYQTNCVCCTLALCVFDMRTTGEL